MKTTICIFLILQLFISLFGQEKNPNYDSTLAKTLGSDDYGMKMYVLVILKTGTNVIEDKPTIDSLFRGHLMNINRLADQGLLVVAGPLGKNDHNYRGIFILNVESLEEATVLLQSDPAIRENILGFNLYNWYGSAAIPEYLKFHNKIEKYKMDSK